MKNITEYLVCEKFQKGKYTKGMKVIMCYCSDWPEESETRMKATTYTAHIESIKTSTIEKVVSKDLGRYSGDQHTWIYIDSVRYVCLDVDSCGCDAELDTEHSKNKGNKQCVLVFTEKSLKNILNNGGKYHTEYKFINGDVATVDHVYDFSKVDEKELDDVLK